MSDEEVKEKLLIVMKDNNINYDNNKFEEVLKYAKSIYKDEFRYTGQTYFEHTLGVAKEVANLKLDEDSIYSSILHELPKFKVSFSEITLKFGQDISDLIKGVDRLSYLNYANNDKLDIQILRKMFMAIAKDVRVILIKLADRLYNMRKADEMNEEFRILKAKETLEIYSPIAHRLGISHIKSELEDISFRILMNKEYLYIKSKIDAKKTQREEYIKNRIIEITNRLKNENVVSTIYGRPKHFYSIYKKIKEKESDVDDIFDLLAIRIVVDSVKDCYNALGIVHEMYKPMPGRFKDYIAVPKTNNYQSLHTTVFGDSGVPFEIQIRTWDMHRHAEYGIAAHFMYKEKTKEINETEKKIMWIRHTLELQKELTEGVSNLSSFKGELFGEEVFAFTPKGELKSLPKGSTTIDFAYSIHQNIAEKMTGAKINGKLVPISTKLNNTDVVQIITSASSNGPNLDWINHVKTGSAKNKIMAYLKKQGSSDNFLRGKDLFEKEVKKQKIAKEELLKEEYLKELPKYLKVNKIDNVYENIGFGTLSYVKAVNRLVEIYNKNNKVTHEKLENKTKVKKNSIDTVIVEGLNNCLVKFAKCCSPIPGDEIVGYITYSNGVSIHRKDCKNLKGLDILNRKINVKWKDKVKSSFITNIKIMANFRETLTIDIIKKLQELKIDILTIKASKNADREMIVDISINTENSDNLTEVIRKLKKIDSVYDVKRAK
ncbi:MAG: bifunctional (p)ppGpp synthetase/guanosine-3',5'-bis(diphosphate) 3'-pyrophosphohydrolase [Clostridia bacterium]